MTKKIILSFAALSISFAAMSQARFGVKGGVNFSTITKSNTGSITDKNALTGWNIGVIADLPLVPKILSFQPGVFYSTKGTKLETGNKDNPTVADPYSKVSMNPSYIEIPLNFIGKIPLGASGHTKLFAGVGPYFAFGIAGKYKNDYKTSANTTVSTSNKIQWDNYTPFNSSDPNEGYDKMKRFDWGGNVQIGAEIRNFLIAAQYGIGFAKIGSGEDSSTDDNNKNRVFSISVGYLFGGK